MSSIQDRWEQADNVAIKAKVLSKTYLAIDSTVEVEGVLWASIYLPNEYILALKKYIKLPDLIEINKKILRKVSWDSDRYVAHYKQIPFPHETIAQIIR